MAAPSSAVWEVRSATGSDSNGGFFLPGSGGTDYSQRNSPQLSVSDIVTVGTGTVTSVTGGFTSAMIGNGINIAGTVYEITAVATGNSITVNGSPGAATGQTGNVGGAVASPGFAGGQAGSANTVWLNGNFTIANGASNTSGNVFSISGGVASQPTLWAGYSTTRGDGGQATLTPSANSLTVVSLGSGVGYAQIFNITVSSPSITGTNGFSTSSTASYLQFYNCFAKNCGGTGFVINNSGPSVGGATDLTGCEALSCGTGFDTHNTTGGSGIYFNFCVASGNTGIGFRSGYGGMLAHCASISNGSHGFYSNTGHTTFLNCIAHSNSTTGFNCAATGSNNYLNCIATNNGTGFAATSGDQCMTVMRNCWWYNNNTNYSNILSQNIIGGGALSVLPYVNATTGNYNVTAASGLQGISVPATLPGLGNTTTYLDVGATGHAASGFLPIGMNGGIRG